MNGLKKQKFARLGQKKGVGGGRRKMRDSVWWRVVEV